jgi:L-lactate dehydrogenase
MSSGNTKPISRIAIIGVGQVGAAAAYALILGSVANELLLVDIKVDLRDGQVRDLSDVAYSCNSGTRVRAATYHEAGQCDIVVITAGSKYSIGKGSDGERLIIFCPKGASSHDYSGQNNIQLMFRNIAIVRSAVRAMKPFRSDAILLVVANPVDLLTSLAQELSGLPPSQVLGSGTFLDSVRLRGMLADKAEVRAHNSCIVVQTWLIEV